MSKEQKVRCPRLLINRMCPGFLQRWRGTDGHNGSEWFYTCDHCGYTS